MQVNAVDYLYVEQKGFAGLEGHAFETGSISEPPIQHPGEQFRLLSFWLGRPDEDN